MPNKELLLHFAELKIKADQIKDELELIKPAVLLELEEVQYSVDNQGGIILNEFPHYVFTIKPGRKSWTYSDVVTALMERVKQEQEHEEKERLQKDSGPATFVEGEKIIQYAKRREKKT